MDEIIDESGELPTDPIPVISREIRRVANRISLQGRNESLQTISGQVALIEMNPVQADCSPQFRQAADGWRQHGAVARQREQRGAAVQYFPVRKNSRIRFVQHDFELLVTEEFRP